MSMTFDIRLVWAGVDHHSGVFGLMPLDYGFTVPDYITLDVSNWERGSNFLHINGVTSTCIFFTKTVLTRDELKLFVGEEEPCSIF